MYPVLLFLSFMFSFTTIYSMQAQHAAAGVLPYAWHNGQWHVLLGKEERWTRQIFKQFYWSDFGGRAEPTDGNDVTNTAAREFSEETRSVYGNGNKVASIAYIKARLGNAPTVSNTKYTLFFVLVDYKPAQAFTAYTADKHSEKIAYTWIAVQDLLADLKAKNNQITKQYDGCAIFSYTYTWLSQKEVIAWFEQLPTQHPATVTHHRFNVLVPDQKQPTTLKAVTLVGLAAAGVCAVGYVAYRLGLWAWKKVQSKQPNSSKR